MVDNILCPFSASAVYKLTSREAPMWIVRGFQSTEAEQKQAFTAILQPALPGCFLAN
jgi:hypothetical protein